MKTAVLTLVLFGLVAVYAQTVDVASLTPQYIKNLTTSMLTDPRFTNGVAWFKAQHQTNALSQGYWQLALASHSGGSPVYGSTTVYNSSGYCIDLDHSLGGASMNSSWALLGDFDDLVATLHKIGFDEPGFHSTNCNLYAQNVIAMIADQTVIMNGNVANVHAQLSATKSWCDVLRIVKYRGALQWIMANRKTWQTKKSNDTGIPSELLAALRKYGCPVNMTLNHGYTQASIWSIIENQNKTSGNGLVTPPLPVCVNAIVETALTNNAFSASCTQEGSVQSTPIIIRPWWCNNITDNSTAGRSCSQYLLVEHSSFLQCSQSTSVSNFTINGYVYADDNCNGRRGTEDQDVPSGWDLSGITVLVISSKSDETPYTTYTNAQGFYSIVVPAEPGVTYRVVVPLAGDGYNHFTLDHTTEEPSNLSPAMQAMYSKFETSATTLLDATNPCSGQVPEEPETGDLQSYQSVTGEVDAVCGNFNFPFCPKTCPCAGPCEPKPYTKPTSPGITNLGSASSSGYNVKLCFTNV